MPSSRQVGSTSASTPRSHSEYSVCKALIGMNGMGPAQRSRAGLGQTQVADLAGLHQVGHGADGVLDRHVRIDAVLIQQVDVVGAEALQGRLDDFLDVLGPAVGAGGLAVRA